MAEQLDQNVVALMRAIRTQESGNRAVLPQEKGIGGASIYQYTTGTWKGVAGKYLGDPNAELNRANENKATYFRIKEWKDKGYKPAQIASMWNAGEGEPDAYTGKFSNGNPSIGVNSYGVNYNVPNHAKNVIANYKKEIAKIQSSQPKTPQINTVQPQISEEKPRLLKSIGSALISAEKGFVENLAMASAVSGFGKTGQAIKEAEQSQAGLDRMNKKLADKIIELKKQGKNTDKLQKLWSENTGRVFNLSDITGGVIDKTAKQIFGEGAGVALDVATAGTYGTAAKSAKTGQLLTKSPKIASVAEKLGVGVTKPLLTKAPVPSVLKQVGAGAGVGYGYDVAAGLQEGESIREAVKPGLGTVIGAAAPLAIKGVGVGAGKIKQATPELAKTRFVSNLNNVFEKAPQSIRKLFLDAKNKGTNIGEELANRDAFKYLKVDNERLKFGEEFLTKIDDEIAERGQLIDSLVEQYPDTIIKKNELKRVVNNIIKNDKDIVAQGRVADVQKKANAIIDNFADQKGSDIFSLSDIQFHKKGMWKATKEFDRAGMLGESDAYSEIGRGLMKIVEDEVPDAAVRNINKEIGKAQELYKILNKINTLQDGGIVLKGGKLGKYGGDIFGGLSGMVAGGVLGGPAGIILGGFTGKKVSDVLRNLSQKSSILSSLDRLLIRFAKEAPKNIDVKAAQTFLEAVKAGKKPAVTPRVLKAFEEAHQWATKKYGAGKNLALPPARPGAPKGTINLPQMSETSRLKSMQDSGIVGAKKPQSPIRPPKDEPYSARFAERKAQADMAREFTDENMEFGYSEFKKILQDPKLRNAKAREAVLNGDEITLKNELLRRGIATKDDVDNILYSQEMKNDEVLEKFKERLIEEDPKLSMGATTAKNLGYKKPFDVNEIAFGGVAGVETYEDEKGIKRIRYSPEKGAIGMGLMAGVGKVKGKNPSKITKPIVSKKPPKLQPLAEEARKYKSAEEYRKAIRDKFVKEQGFEPSSMGVVDEWWQAKQTQPFIGIGGANPEFFSDRPFLSDLPKAEVSKYLEFTKDGKAIYYRGIPKEVKTRGIRWGDFISPERGKASQYGKVERYELDPKYVKQLGDLEAVYFNPSDKLQAPEPKSIEQIWKEAQNNS